MSVSELPHKLFAVLTAPEGQLLYRKMWARRLWSYLAGISAIHHTNWKDFVQHAEIGQVWPMPHPDGTWMVIVRIRDDEDRDDAD